MQDQSADVTRREFLQMAGATALSISAASGKKAWGEQPAVISFPASPSMKKAHNLSQLKWTVAGFVPYLWAIDKLTDIRNAPDAEVGPIPAPVPGSVQKALLDAGVIRDWNVGLNAREAEWVENRDWVYQAELPDEWLHEGKQIWLRCAGLDYAGAILINGTSVLPFKGSFIPYEVDLKPFLHASGNLLQIWFQQSPRWLGEFGYTSQIKEWRPRFNYYWDWTSRLVQIGIWDNVTLEIVQEGEITHAKCITRATPESKQGELRVALRASGGKYVHVTLRDQDRIVHEETVTLHHSSVDMRWDKLPVELWWPNEMGDQRLYTVRIALLDEQKQILDSRELRVGFRHIEWKQTQGAPKEAAPYLCVVNGKPVFLFGVNWTPIRPNFADLQEEDYRKRVTEYRNIGMNVLRVWGGGFLERSWFYDLCDEAGLLVWQEFPLCSSGLDNCPPDDDDTIRDQSAFAHSYIQRIQHHACVAVWCGGNELEDNRAGHVSSDPTLTIAHHPLVKKLGEIVKEDDPDRAYLPTAPYGRVGVFTRETCGQNKHWDVHGPYVLNGPVDGEWRDLWSRDDAMFHSETGCPSTSSAEIIRRFKGDLPATPGTHANPLWNRQPWWVEWQKFVQERGHEPSSLEEFVEWSQKRQADALALALNTARSRFPACGGIILWMGHDSFPCTANTSIIDFDGNPKPAATALRDQLALQRR